MSAPGALAAGSPADAAVRELLRQSERGAVSGRLEAIAALSALLVRAGEAAMSLKRASRHPALTRLPPSNP